MPANRKQSTTMASPQVLGTRLVLNWGNEDVPKLRQRLLEKWPLSVFRVVELREESREPRVITWELPVAGGYSQENAKHWKDFRSLVSSTWTNDQAGEALFYATYTIHADGKPVGILERRTDAGGARDYLDGKAIQCGSSLEALLDTGAWLQGRYEMAHRKDGIIPMFHYGLWRGEACFAIDETTVLRWSC